MPGLLSAPRRLRLLHVSAAQHPRGQAFISAASGLVCAHGRAYVIGDDEHHLAVFDGLHSPGRLLRVRAGALPQSASARKRRKPDFETLLHWPAGAGKPGALLALGSGSASGRDSAALITLAADGEPLPHVRRIDLAPLYAPLRRRLGRINIEGAMIIGGELVVLHRGAAGQASVSMRYAVGALEQLARGVADELQPRQMQEHVLGEMSGVTLAFTDGAALADGGFLFSAVAEDSADAVADGACLGSAVGHIDASGALRELRLLAPRIKVEGLALRATRSAVQLAMVTDADDPGRASELLLARW